MNHNLICHPTTPMPQITAVSASAARPAPGRIALSFSISGDMSAIILPHLMPAKRADDLWRSTCFEVFLAVDGKSSYSEFNLSPSGQWAAYRFEDYRTGRTDLDWGVANVRFDVRMDDTGFDFSVVLDASDLPEDCRTADWQMGLSAVLEGRDGACSYWAMRHGNAEKPDFHARDCFIGLLQAPPGP